MLNDSLASLLRMTTSYKVVVSCQCVRPFRGGNLGNMHTFCGIVRSFVRSFVRVRNSAAAQYADDVIGYRGSRFQVSWLLWRRFSTPLFFHRVEGSSSSWSSECSTQKYQKGVF